MEFGFLLVQCLSGLASASSLFIIASGLTLVFGVTRIVNFAHGSFYMLGAYMAVTIVPWLLQIERSPTLFFAAVLISALVVGVLGVVMEILLLRRIYKVPELFQLLATFGVVLMVQDAVLKIWGPMDITGPRAPGLRHGVMILDQRFPAYELFLIAAGPVVLGLLWLLMKKTRFGILLRAATRDREMVGALGVNQAMLFTGTLFLGAFLAGLGGALQIPRVSASAQMDLSIITEAFVVTVIGGMGSIGGAFLAALLIGQLQAFGVLIFPKITLVLVFLLMALVLVIKPWGLLGRPEAAAGHSALPEGIMRPRGFAAAEKALVLLAIVAAAAVPIFGDAYAIKVATEVLIFALAAFSLNFLVGNGGIVSFGHAAYFGLGAYASGLLVTKLGMPMEPALIAAPLAGGFFAALFGFFVVRLQGIYLAMLTLAFAQIAYAVCFQWVEVTGGDNGIVGVWPSAWAAPRSAYHYIVLVAAVAGIFALRHVIYAPFGASLRAARDSAPRAEAIGIDVRSHRWLGFTIAGAAAGLAGGLYAFSKGSIDPTLLGIPLSVDFLAMILLGGMQTVMGPVLGAAAFHSIKDVFMPLTDHWRFLLGASIIALVLIFPRGLGGAYAALRARLSGGAP
ncbi:MAG: ABC transporter permease [Roseomonas sp.]|nr:ABC transporter permease [Roseomonas sp.]MCA3431642.1 ABC transporter permease [Roseomonas sp.]MCA3434834.1 ABC transporter permease [Roseomonas sp.]